MLIGTVDSVFGEFIEDKCLVHYRAKIERWNTDRHEWHLKDQETAKYSLESHKEGLGKEALRRAEKLIRTLDQDDFKITSFSELFEGEYREVLDEDRAKKASPTTRRDPEFRSKAWENTTTKRDAMTPGQQEKTSVRKTYHEEYDKLTKHDSAKRQRSHQSKNGKDRQ